MTTVWARGCPLQVCFANGPHCHRVCSACGTTGFTNLVCDTCRAFQATIVDDVSRRLGEEPPIVRPPGYRRPRHHFIAGPGDTMVSVHDHTITKTSRGTR